MVILKDSENKIVQYKLKSAIIHLGKDIHIGHYIALILHDNIWLKYNDNEVTVT